jgi:hypothetical protein
MLGLSSLLQYVASLKFFHLWHRPKERENLLPLAPVARYDGPLPRRCGGPARRPEAGLLRLWLRLGVAGDSAEAFLRLAAEVSGSAGDAVFNP